MIIKNYRVPNWLMPDARDYISNHYTEISTHILVPGFRVNEGEQRTEKLIQEGLYEIQAKKGAQCKLNNALILEKNKPFALKIGPYKLESEKGQCILLKYFSPKSLALLQNSNPQGYAYLISPKVNF
jgi:hypothetical protein